MDIPEASAELLNNKQSLEHLSKDELVQKYLNLLTVTQKATATTESPQTADIVTSKEVPSEAGRILSIDKQKPDFASVLEADNIILTTNTKAINVELDNVTKNDFDLKVDYQSLKDQIPRIFDGNKHFLRDVLEIRKQEVCLNKIGLEQRRQLLCLEQSILSHNSKSNVSENLKDLQETLVKSSGEIKKLKHENNNFNIEIRPLNDTIVDEKKTISMFTQDLQNSEVIIRNLEAQLLESRDALDKCKQFNQKNDKNMALVEVLQSKNCTLSQNQILSGGLMCDFEIEHEKLKERNKFFHSKIITFAAEVRKLRTDKENILVAFKNYNSNVNIWKGKLEKLSYFLTFITTKNDSIKEIQLLNEKCSNQNLTIDLLNKEIKEKTEDLEKFKQSIDKFQCTISELSQKNAILLNQLQLSTETESELPSSKSTEKINRIINEKDKFDLVDIEHKEDNLNVSKSLKDYNSSGLTFTSEDCCNMLKRENAELLGELHISNQPPDRKEPITPSQIENQTILIKLPQNVAEFNKVSTMCEKDHIIFALQEHNNSIECGMVYNELISEDNMDITALQREIVHVKDLPEANLARKDAENDTICSLSRTDDLGQFKEHDTSWEDRYRKLRPLALKQKARIRDLTIQLSDIQSNVTHLNLKLCNSMQAVQISDEKCNGLQEELNRAKEESTQYLMKLSKVAPEICQHKITLALNNDDINGLRSQVKLMEKDKSKTELWKKQVSVKVQSLKKELEAKEVLKHDFDLKLSDLKIQLTQKDQLLSDEVNRHVETKNHLQDLTSDSKKQSVLNLEMQDYERSRKELNQRLEKRVEECNNLQQQVNVLNESSKAQCEKIQALEAQIMQLDREVNDGRQEITNMQKKSASLETTLNEKEISIHELAGSFEEMKRENEDLNLQISKIIAGQSKMLDSIRNERDVFQVQVLDLERRLTEVDESMHLKDMELSNVKTEYKGYKVRAQSVLRQNHSRDIGTEEKLSEEADSLRSSMNVIQIECEELRYSISEMKMSHDNLIKEKLILNNNILDMQRTLDLEKEKYNLLSTKYDDAVIEQSESIKNLQTQSDALASCYRTKFNELGCRQNEEILKLQAMLNQCSICHSTNIVESQSPSSSAQIMCPPMTREAAEGSESTINVNTICGTTVGLPTGRNQHSLEKLLEVEVGDVDILALRRQLMDQESRVTHLTELLADTEQDLAKHAQMNLMLKEEIRRQQRSFEREKHAENLEYMKNIIVKFITLSNGDERQRLVPVLNTILRLSPEETRQINAIAKGDSQGWYNYIPTWNKLQQ